MYTMTAAASPLLARSDTYLFTAYDSAWSCRNALFPLKRGFHLLTNSKKRQDRLCNANASNLAVLMEVDGVIADFHQSGHRQSFNAAFQKLGLDCANWTKPVYWDLLRQAGGEEERMLTTFFDRIGWPMSLPTDEKQAFVGKLMHSKQIELESFAQTDNLALQSGFLDFVDSAIEDKVPLVVLTSYSKAGEQISRFVIRKLGSERLRSIKVIGSAEVESSAYAQVVLGSGVSSGLDEVLAAEAAKSVAEEKQRVAEEVASLLKLSVEIDTTSAARLKEIVTTLRAGAEYAEMSVDRCVLLAGGYIGVQAANRIGMPCVVVRSSLTARAEFPTAKDVLEGFGCGTVTLSRLRNLLHE